MKISILLLLLMCCCTPKVITKTITQTKTDTITIEVGAERDEAWYSLVTCDSVVYIERTDTLTTTRFVKLYQPSKTETKVIHDTINIVGEAKHSEAQTAHNEEKPQRNYEWLIGMLLFVGGMLWLCWSVYKDVHKR